MKNICITFTVLFIFTSCQQSKVDMNYLGQTPPGDSAVIFAPGIIGTGMKRPGTRISGMLNAWRKDGVNP
jgi:hypothetical protein